jgi:hypothetical protein
MALDEQSRCSVTRESNPLYSVSLIMKQKYRLYQRKNGVFYLQNNDTGEQRSLKTTDTGAAKKLLSAENEAHQKIGLSFELGKVYLRAGDAQMARRSWKDVLAEICCNGKTVSKERYERAFRSACFDLIREKPLIETTAEDLFAVIKKGGTSANHFLRRLHNFASANEWIFRNIIPAKKWPTEPRDLSY